MIGKLIFVCIFLHIHYTNAQNTSPLLTTCNNCCQGQAGREGNPGIPGVPGINGNQGIMGPKGDKGESVKGEMGDVGALGPEGPAGITGLPGVKGQKGEIGQSRGDSVSAFTAVRITRFTPSSANSPLSFERFHTNFGDDFDLGSGRFTCEIPGIYSFTYSLLTLSNNPYVSLMKDDTVINSVRNVDTAPHQMLSSAAVLQLDTGEQVWLRCGISIDVIFSDSNFYTSFSGVLLHEL